MVLRVLSISQTRPSEPALVGKRRVTAKSVVANRQPSWFSVDPFGRSYGWAKGSLLLPPNNVSAALRVTTGSR